MRRALVSWPMVIVSAFWLASLFIAQLSPGLLDKARFWLFPVVSMKGDLVERTDQYAIVHIYGEKHRGPECKYLGVQAFGDRTIGLPVDMHISRVDIPEEGRTKPSGSYDIGNWRVWPVEGVVRVRVYVEHDCLGVRVGTQIAEVRM